MIYVILNAVLAAFIIWTSMNVNTKNQSTESSMINVMLFDAAAAIVMFLIVLSIFYAPEKIIVLLEHLEIFLIAAIFIEVSLLFFTISKQKKSAFTTILRIIFLVFAAFIAFTKIQIAEPATFTMSSSHVFNDSLKMTFPITWIQMFCFIYIFGLPLFSIIIMLLNAENTNSRLGIQKAAMGFASIVFSWLGMVIIYLISDMLPMMRSLFMYIVSVMVIFVLNTVSQDKIYDGGMIFSTILSVIVKYFIPAAIGAIVYVGLRPLYNEHYWTYISVIFFGIFFIMIIGRIVSSGFSKLIRYRSSQYEVEFEKALAAIDYDNELSDISKEFYKAFQDNLQTKSLSVLVDTGLGEFTTAFNSEGKNDKFKKSAKLFEVLMNTESYIIFREEIRTNYLLQVVADELEDLFDEIESEVIILLHEGHHVLGLLTLGQKRTESAYDEYDKHVFDRFYSYFFVFGYYMKNIANASVVGTVNREIRMSSQIITSIQENMDYIKNPKVDVGYLMVPSHNIGGEFVDLIRLNSTSHIMIVGSLSGKGISASMSMVILKSIIRTFLADTHDFKKLIQKINAFIRFNLPKGTFFSGVFCLVDFAKDTMYYVNCGIPTLLMYSKTYNNVIEIQGKGYVLGFVKDISPLTKVKQIKLSSGDMLAISTNGLINSHSLRGETFGKERIKQSLMDNYTYPSSRIVKFVYDNLQRFMSKELEDDITLLVVRYFGKDGVEIIEDTESSQEKIIEHIGSFDPDALIADAMEDASIEVSDAEPAVKEESFIPPVVVDHSSTSANSEAEFSVSENSTENINLADSVNDEMFNDEMFNTDFTNPSSDIDVGNINIDDTVK